MNIHTLLQKYFGFRDFKPGQKPVIEAVSQGRDVFSLMQTGGGKSLCFQIPALAREGICLVVCPLISLMYDQVHTLKKRGIEAEFLNSQLDYNDRVNIEKKAVEGKLKFLYVAPERIISERFFDLLQQMKISMIVYDEAHVITEWGEAFRPAYIMALEKIKELESHWASHYAEPNFRFQKVVLSASIIAKARDDIIEKSNLVRPALFIQSFSRSNIKLNVLRYQQESKNKLALLVADLKQHPKTTSIIYAGSRKECETISDKLNVRGIRASHYHAGLKPADRKMKMDLFMQGKIDVIVCTSAFGMGIDKKNVRQVYHWLLPPTLEDMYQEMGRAGRDGLQSQHTVFYDKADLEFSKRMLTRNYPTVDAVNKLYHFIRVYCEQNNEHTIEEDPSFLADIVGEPVIKDVIPAIFDHFQRVGFLSEIKSDHNPNAPRKSLLRVFEVNDDVEDIALNSVSKRHNTAFIKLQSLEAYFETKACRSRHLLKYLGEPGFEQLPKMCNYCDNCVPSHAPAKEHSFVIEADNLLLIKRVNGLVKSFAKRKKLPTHVVVSPQVVHKICAMKPTSIDELRRCGISEKAADELGATLLSIVKEEGKKAK